MEAETSNAYFQRCPSRLGSFLLGACVILPLGGGGGGAHSSQGAGKQQFTFGESFGTALNVSSVAPQGIGVLRFVLLDSLEQEDITVELMEV